MKKTVLMLGAGCALSVTAACSSLSAPPPTPDEFRVVTKAPLVVPPNYNLRPPEAGISRPAEVEDLRGGSATAFGTGTSAGASAAERALVAAAGANAVNPVVRAQVDYEEAKVIRKSTSVSDRIMFWRKGGEGDTGGDSATGEKPVTIERGSGKRLKLPGT